MGKEFTIDDINEKLSNGTTPEDLLKEARENGFELSDEQLDQISGGGFWKNEYEEYYCPFCSSTRLTQCCGEQVDGTSMVWFRCNDCGREIGYNEVSKRTVS